FFQAEDGIRDFHVTGVQTCALPISASGTLASFINWSSPSAIHMGMILFLLMYAYGTYHFTRKQDAERMIKINRWLSHVDAALIEIGRAPCREREESCGGSVFVEPHK